VREPRGTHKAWNNRFSRPREQALVHEQSSNAYYRVHRHDRFLAAVQPDE
jgi:hypothetical protein